MNREILFKLASNLQSLIKEKYNWTVNIRIRKKKDIKNLRY